MAWMDLEKSGRLEIDINVSLLKGSLFQRTFLEHVPFHDSRNPYVPCVSEVHAGPAKFEFGDDEFVDWVDGQAPTGPDCLCRAVRIRQRLTWNKKTMRKKQVLDHGCFFIAAYCLLFTSWQSQLVPVWSRSESH